MTPEQIVFRSCLALWAAAMLFATDQMGAGQVSPKTHVRETWATHPSSASAPTLTASDLAALFSRCVTSALDEDGPDVPAFTYTDPHTERTLAIHCDAVRPVKVVNLERRYVP